MAGLPLKYRPRNFDEFHGNKEVIDQLYSIIGRKMKDIPKSWIFSGGSGTGKTTLVRILRDEFGIAEVDYHEYNASNTRGIDTIRELGGYARMAPMGGKYKMFLLDECHMMTREAQNAMLKLLEDTPPNTFFMLATTDPQKMVKAIKTRCTTVALKDLNYRDLSKLVKEIAGEEGVDIPDKLATSIGKAAMGSPREALKILDQVIDIEDEEKALAAVESSLANESDVIELCQALLNGQKWKSVASIISRMGADPENTRRVILGYMNTVLLDKDDVKAAIIIEHFLKPFYDSGKAGLTFACYSAVADINAPE